MMCNSKTTEAPTETAAPSSAIQKRPPLCRSKSSLEIEVVSLNKSPSELSLTSLLADNPEVKRRLSDCDPTPDDVLRIRTGLLQVHPPDAEEIAADVEDGEYHTLNKVSITNWAETVETSIEQFRYPNTVEEVIDLVKNNSKIRCSGALHSCAPLIVSDGIILSLTKLDKIISINPETRMVKMQSGVRIHDLCTALAPYGLAVGTLGTIDWQTISGAVMTGTHGGALTVASLHDFIRSYTIVKPCGVTVTISKEAEPELFSAMAPSMGVFGAVIELEMEAVPLQYLEAKMTLVPLEDVIDTFQDTMESNKYARIVVYPSINKATLWTANPVESRDVAVTNGARNYPGYCNFRNDEEKMMLKEYLELCNKKDFEMADRTLDSVVQSQSSRLSHYVGQYNHVLCLERNNGIPHADIEFNFDYNKFKDVLETVFKYHEHERIPYYNYEIRTTKRDDAILSCCQGRDAMWIDFQAKADVAPEFFGAMETRLKPIGFRKHWAKGLDNTDPMYLVQQFPRVTKFIKLMKTYDPEGKFRNAQAESWFVAMDSHVTKSALEDAVISSDEENDKDQVFSIGDSVKETEIGYFGRE